MFPHARAHVVIVTCNQSMITAKVGHNCIITENMKNINVGIGAEAFADNKNMKYLLYLCYIGVTSHLA